MVKCLQGDVKTPDNGSHKQSVESVDADTVWCGYQSKKKEFTSGKETQALQPYHVMPVKYLQISAGIVRWHVYICPQISVSKRYIIIYTYLDRDGKENIDMEKYEYQNDVGQLKEKHLTSDLAPNPIPTASLSQWTLKKKVWTVFSLRNM